MPAVWIAADHPENSALTSTSQLIRDKKEELHARGSRIRAAGSIVRVPPSRTLMSGNKVVNFL